MMLRPPAAALPLALILFACDAAEPAREPEAPVPAASPATPAPAAPVAPAPSAAVPPTGVDDGSPDLTPPTLTPEAERGETGARSLLVSFARAIELKEYGQARALLSAADRQRWSDAAFAALFADLADVTVAVPTGTLTGAPGDSRYSAPVTITGRDKDGRPVRLDGTAELRQSAPPGDASSDARWRFESLSIDWTH